MIVLTYYKYLFYSVLAGQFSMDANCLPLGNISYYQGLEYAEC
jgi:hypothetical protein